MNPRQPGVSDFRLGDWLVQPAVNRLSNSSGEVHLEPRAMGLLVFLAANAGNLVTRQQIIDAVWQQEFVGDVTLSSTIAALRRALGDDARDPRYIETIPKRGYRLLPPAVDVLEVVARPGGAFRVGEWLVEPSLNRMSKGDTVVQLEHSTMDVLLCLAERAGEPVPRHELADRVWRTESVSELTVNRRIAELKEALGDSHSSPNYIETVPERGFRLAAAVVAAQPTATVTPFPGVHVEVERDPYPGLAAFTEADADLFFGREAETAAMWRRITSRRLLAVIGPSGVGKSSFLRAGVMAAAPPGWGTLVCAPGEAPFTALARALVPELAGDADQVEQLLSFDDPEVALAVVSRWRQDWNDALLVIDQFEELFTLSPAATRARFVDLILRLVTEARVHVLLAIRDDFVCECHAHPPLAPIFKELTVLGPPAADDLRRALVEPARRRGFRFQDPELPDEMVAAVAEERGALPLLAFAARRLWELRDRERRLLTRDAYREIGGVGGALAQHAEATLDAIGQERRPLGRELFRNLVTAKGTRAVREWDDLLSVFSDSQRESAKEVLRALIAARLLSSYELRDDNEKPTRMVEIVHESLLGEWPRLVRWQTQDADAARLRDQLRQAAQLWLARGRPAELLWTGAPYLEFRAWRESYSAGLSSTEEAFAEAMAGHAGRRRRRRRMVTAALIAALAAVAATVTALWQRSELNVRRVEARRLYQVGREAIGRSPPEALAFALASLEIADSLETRHLALDALGRSPMPMVIPASSFSGLTVGAEFSPDGRWLAIGQIDGTLALVGASGETVASWRAADRATRGHFTPDSRVVVTVNIGAAHAIAWSVPDGALLGSVGSIARADITDVSPPDAANVDRSLRFVGSPEARGGWALDPWPLAQLGVIDLPSSPRVAADPYQSRIVVAHGREIRLLDAADEPDAEGMLVGRSASDVVHLAVDPEGRWVASHGENGEVELWSLDEPDSTPRDAWQAPERTVCNDLRFDPSGDVLCGCYDDGSALLWDLQGPQGADPLVLHPPGTRLLQSGFHPDGGVLSTAGLSAFAIWPLEPGRYPRVLRGHTGEVEQLAFGPDGRFLVSGATDGTIRYWPLHRAEGGSPHVLFDWGHPVEAVVGWLALSGDGRFVVSTGGETSARLIAIDDDSVRTLGSFDQRVYRAAVSPSGRRVAVSGVLGGRLVVQMTNLATGAATELAVPQPHQPTDHVLALQFVADERLLASPRETLSACQPDEQRMQALVPGAGKFFATPDGRFVIARPHPDRSPPYVATVYDLERGSATDLASHGDQVHSLALDPTGAIAVTGSFDGVVRVGPVTGETPHHLVSDSGWVSGVAVSPDGRWIAAGYKDGTIRLWPLPDLTQPPLHALPRPELIARLRSFTNLRVVGDPEDPAGSLVEAGHFPGWQSAPAW